MAYDEDQPARTRQLWLGCALEIKRVVIGLLCLVMCTATLVVIGLIPVNNDFEPSSDGIEIFIISNPVHADLVMPLHTEITDWSVHFPADCFSGNTFGATHVAIGWGDRGFYIETPTWADLRVSTTVKALFWPSKTCMHVTLTSTDYLGEDSRSVFISREQYGQLVDFVNSSFRINEHGDKIQISDEAYGYNGAFFEALGTYHCVNTCNYWVGMAMQAAGIRTGWLTPLPKTVFLYLPE